MIFLRAGPTENGNAAITGKAYQQTTGLFYGIANVHEDAVKKGLRIVRVEGCDVFGRSDGIYDNNCHDTTFGRRCKLPRHYLKPHTNILRNVAI